MSIEGVRITVPNGMTPEEVARTFTAYHLGAGAFANHDGSLGPFFRPSAQKWQLTTANDDWLHVEADGGCILTTRYASDPRREAMVALFHLCHQAPS